MAQQMATPTLTPAVHQLAARYQLGAPIAEDRRWLSRSILIWGVIFGLAGIAAIAYGSGSEYMLAYLLFGLFLIGLASIQPLIFLMNISQRVYVFTEGLVQVRGDQMEVARWDQVEWFKQDITRTTTRYNGIPVSKDTTYIYTLRRADGATLVLRDPLRDMEGLGNTIARATAQRLIPKAVDAYNSGVPVAFGGLSISKQGISLGEMLLSWTQYQGYQISNGMVFIRQQGKPNRLVGRVRDLPNLLVFMTLLDSIQRSQGQTPR